MAKNKRRKSEIELFTEFVHNAGAEILSPTNEYEVLRFKANFAVGVVYQNAAGRITKYVGEAKTAHDAFINKKSWSATDTTERIKKHIVLRTLLERDGTNCFYCGDKMEEGKETIEHLLSISQGGKNHVANLALAHYECNKNAANMSIVEKVRLREKLIYQEQ